MRQLIETVYGAPRGPTGQALQLAALDIVARQRLPRSFGRGLVVHQMGRVGSRAVFERALDLFEERRLPAYDFVAHTHVIGPEWQERSRRLRAERRWAPTLALATGRRIERLVRDQNLHIDTICLFRDPIERNLSSYFFGQNRYLSRPRTGGAANQGTGQLLRQFVDVFPHDEPSNWIEHEFFGYLGAPREPFVGGSVLGNRGRILCLETSLLAEAPESLAAFTELRPEDWNLPVVNKARTSYASLYREALRSFDAPASIYGPHYASGSPMGCVLGADRVRELARRWRLP